MPFGRVAPASTVVREMVANEVVVRGRGRPWWRLVASASAVARKMVANVAVARGNAVGEVLVDAAAALEEEVSSSDALLQAVPLDAVDEVMDQAMVYDATRCEQSNCQGQ